MKEEKKPYSYEEARKKTEEEFNTNLSSGKTETIASNIIANNSLKKLSDFGIENLQLVKGRDTNPETNTHTNAGVYAVEETEDGRLLALLGAGLKTKNDNDNVQAIKDAYMSHPRLVEYKLKEGMPKEIQDIAKGILTSTHFNWSLGKRAWATPLFSPKRSEFKLNSDDENITRFNETLWNNVEANYGDKFNELRDKYIKMSERGNPYFDIRRLGGFHISSTDQDKRDYATAMNFILERNRQKNEGEIPFEKKNVHNPNIVVDEVHYNLENEFHNLVHHRVKTESSPLAKILAAAMGGEQGSEYKQIDSPYQYAKKHYLDESEKKTSTVEERKPNKEAVEIPQGMQNPNPVIGGAGVVFNDINKLSGKLGSILQMQKIKPISESISKYLTDNPEVKRNIYFTYESMVPERAKELSSTPGKRINETPEQKEDPKEGGPGETMEDSATYLDFLKDKFITKKKHWSAPRTIKDVSNQIANEIVKESNITKGFAKWMKILKSTDADVSNEGRKILGMALRKAKEKNAIPGMPKGNLTLLQQEAIKSAALAIGTYKTKKEFQENQKEKEALSNNEIKFNINKGSYKLMPWVSQKVNLHLNKLTQGSSQKLHIMPEIKQELAKQNKLDIKDVNKLALQLMEEFNNGRK